MNSLLPEHQPRNVLALTARLFLYATTAVPLVVFPGFFFPFVTTRAVFFRVLVELSIAVLLYLVLRRKVTIHARNDYVLWALAGWVAANGLAALFGVAPMRSLFGDYERMGGVWFWAHMFAFYVALRCFMGDKDWAIFFGLAAVIATAIAAYGLWQSWLDPFPNAIGGVETGVTIGNNGLLAVYLLANVAICALVAAQTRALPRAACGSAIVVLIVAIVFSSNRSSTLALGVGSAIGTLAYLLWTKSLRGRQLILVGAIAAAVISLPFATRAPWAKPVVDRAPSLSRLSSGVDSSRVIQWRAAVEGIRQRPLLGFGPENYGIVWSSYYHPEMYRFTTDAPWDRAHNAFLEAFATAGVLGFLSLLAVFLAMIWQAHRSAKARREPEGGATAKSPAVEAVAVGFFAAYAFYLFFWFFDINSTMLWIALAAFITSRNSSQLIAVEAPRDKRWQTAAVLGFGAAALVALLYVHGFETLRVARTLDRLRAPNRAPIEVLEDYESVFGSPAPVTHHVFLMYASHLASLRSTFEQIRNSAVGSAVFDRAFVLAIEEFERQTARDPLNERILVQHARVLMLGANYYGNMRLYESGLRQLQRGVEVAPRRIPTRLALGMAYLNVQRAEQALSEFRKAYSLYPPHGQTQAYLGLAYASLGQHREAVRWLSAASAAGYRLDYSILSRIANALVEAGEPALAAELTRRHLTDKYGPTFMWNFGAAPGDLGDYNIAKITAQNLALAGDSSSAQRIEAAAELLCMRTISLRELGAPTRSERARPAPDCRQPWRRNAA